MAIRSTTKDTKENMYYDPHFVTVKIALLNVLCVLCVGDPIVQFDSEKGSTGSPYHPQRFTEIGIMFSTQR